MSIINEFGIDVLKSPYLVNMLQDYGAFDVHNIDDSQIKSKLSELVDNGQIGEFLSWKHLSKESQKRKWKKLLIKYDNDYAAKTIFESISIALEIAHIDVQHTNASTSKLVNNAVIRNAGKKRNNNNYHSGSRPQKDYHKILRVLLYIITVWNVIQLLSGIERVITWDVWNWGWLFNVIGIPLGIIGFAIGVLLPAFVVAYLCHIIESSNKVNYKKTNIFLVILDLAGVYALYVMSKSHYTISEKHYSDYGRYAEDIDYTLWSLHHIWIILRPLAYLIGGIVAIALLLLILRVSYYVTIKLLVIVKHALTKYFTS